MKRRSSWSLVGRIAFGVLMISQALPGLAGPIPIDAAGFMADPASHVEFGMDGSATIFEDDFFGSTLLTNAPPSDSEVLVASVGEQLSFNYNFAIGTFDTDDLFIAVLLQDGLALGSEFEFSTDQAGTADVRFDLTDLAGLANIGIEFSLVSGLDGVYGSQVVISDLRVAPIPVASTLLLFAAGLFGLRRTGISGLARVSAAMPRCQKTFRGVSILKFGCALVRGSRIGGVLIATLSAPFSGALLAAVPPAPSVSDFPIHAGEKVELGRLLFYDKLLSGNRNISCATCHHSLTFTGDGLALPVGEGGIGLGVARNVGTGAETIRERVPRNAPALFNLGAFEFQEMFHDGRLQVDVTHPSGFLSPAGDALPLGLDSALAAQAMFPVMSGAEMAGQVEENAVADAAVVSDWPEIWRLLAARLQDPANGYIELFQTAYPAGTASPPDGPGPILDADDITFVHAANAIAAFEDTAFRAINSPYDRFLRGDRRALSYRQQAGMRLFYGKAGCSNCHLGAFQTDHDYHAIAVPQIGPGKGDVSPDGQLTADYGRERVTLNPIDRYRFRTPTLRNVACTGPWGHDGAYNTLEAVVRHHLDPVLSLHAFDTSQVALPPHAQLDTPDFANHESIVNRNEIAGASELAETVLSDREVELLIEFLHALTDPASMDLRPTVPMTVPSGLPVAD